MATETFTLIVWLYVGGQHEMIRFRNLNQADCTAIAEEVQRTQPGLEAWCRPRESQYASAASWGRRSDSQPRRIGCIEQPKQLGAHLR